MPDLVVSRPAVAATPADVLLPSTAEWLLLAVKATFDGSSATVPFVPTLEIVTDAAITSLRLPTTAPVQAGGSADVTWGEGLGGDQAATALGTALDVNVSAAGVTQLVAAVANKRIRVLQAAIMSAGTTAITFRSAANDLAGPYNLAAATGFVLPQSPQGFWMQTNVGEALNLNNSLAIQIAGMIVYQIV